MPGGARLGDKAKGVDGHGCTSCPHSVIGPATQGSDNVMINYRPAVRMGDGGIHAACCGPNKWTAAMGSTTVYINGMMAVRNGDMTVHCGGVGNMVEGSTDVIIG